MSSGASTRSLPFERVALPVAGAFTGLALLVWWRRRGERDLAQASLALGPVSPTEPDEPTD